MSIQSSLNKAALKMLPACLAYISSCAGDRAAHHRYVVLQAICNTKPCLDDKTPVELAEFDAAMAKHLEMLDTAA